jgi:methionyl-tRNA formyltransferase
MSKLKLAYFGDGPWSHAALVSLAERKDDFDIAFVAPRFDNKDPELCRLALERNFNVRHFKDVNSAETLAEIQALEIDVIVSMSFNQIFKAPLLALPRIGTVNCHAGALPRYRGRNVLNWALINGETEFGVTAHFVDTGIDTGDILHQEMIPISDKAQYRDLLSDAYDACPRVLIAALDKLLYGTAEPQPQHTLGTGFYCGRRGPGDEWIDWAWSAERIVNFVRAIAPPGPGAITMLEGELVAVVKATCDPNSPSYIGTEGEVVGRDELGVWVKASNRTVRLERCQNEGAQEWYTPRFKIGKRLINKQEYRLSKLEKASGRFHDL